MAVMTKPGKISESVILPILVYMMHRQGSRIRCFAQTTSLQYMRAFHNGSVGTLSRGEVLMLLANIKFVSPSCLTAFIAEELSAFRTA